MAADMRNAAAALYGDPAERPAAPDYSGFDSAAIEAGIPPELLQARQADPMREEAALQLADVIPDAKAEGLSPAVAAAITRELRHMVLDAGAGPEDVQVLREALRAAAADPPTEAMQRVQERQAMAALRGAYGATADEVLALVHAWCKQDPRRMRLFDRPGVGDDPRVVMTLARLAVAGKLAGKGAEG